MRDRVFSMRFSPEEWEWVARAAKRADRDPTDWVRRTLLRVAKQQLGRRRRKPPST